jgi:hypothetical protein
MKSQSRPSSGSIASRLSLATRLYSIFALFALLTAAIAVLSNYNSSRSTEITEAIERANLAALNVERVNSLVYAVVMESRGVYMSTEPAVVKKFGDGLLKFNDQILAVVKHWESIVQADDAEQFAAPTRSAPPPAANGATTMPTAPSVRRSTKTSRRCPRSIASVANGSQNKPNSIANCPLS